MNPRPHGVAVDAALAPRAARKIQPEAVGVFFENRQQVAVLRTGSVAHRQSLLIG
jgi:hypothetical protein